MFLASIFLASSVCVLVGVLCEFRSVQRRFFLLFLVAVVNFPSRKLVVECVPQGFSWIAQEPVIPHNERRLLGGSIRNCAFQGCWLNWPEMYYVVTNCGSVWVGGGELKISITTYHTAHWNLDFHGYTLKHPSISVTTPCWLFHISINQLLLNVTYLPGGQTNSTFQVHLSHGLLFEWST